MLEIFKNFLDYLFPIECLGCKKEGQWLCQECLKSIPLIPLEDQNCAFCKRPSYFAKTCFKCQAYLEGALVASTYRSQLLKKSIQAFKYKQVQDLAKPLGKILVKFLDSGVFRQGGFLTTLWLKNLIFIPVPLHKKRFLERGFNQATLLARELEKSLGLRVENSILKRNRYTTAQVNLKGALRKRNIKDAFVLVDKKKVKGKIVFLIDDVLTTGATLNECAKVLKKAGAREVWALVLARG